jgi:chemotaxis family two-component system response regulator PixG
MTATTTGYANTAKTLAALTQHRATGELSVNHPEQQWKFYFFQGRLVYATSNFHRQRRWARVSRLHCPGVHFPHLLSHELGEYQLLAQGLDTKQLTLPQAQAIIKTSLSEGLLTWISHPGLSSHWSTRERFPLSNTAALGLLLSATQLQEVLQQVQLLWQQWRQWELGTLSPDAAPVLQLSLQAASPAISSLPTNLIPLLNGQHTFWDIAYRARKPVTTLIHFLLHWMQQGTISLEELPDLPAASPSRSVATPLNQGSSPLIACIDDSPTVGHLLSGIFEPAGYRVLTIQNPFEGLGTLSQCNPALIFLDLAMPDVNGYDLCTFLRKTSRFDATPIIILTSQDTLVDRTRAKLVGASDFVSKQAGPQVLLNLVQQYL